MPVFPALFVLNLSSSIPEFKFYIPQIDTNNLTVIYLDGIAFASNLPLNQFRGSNDIYCDELPFEHQHKYELKCLDTYMPTTYQPTPEPTPKPSQTPTLTPTLDACILNDTFEFVFVVDNSCGLNDFVCNIQLEHIAELLSKLK
eukprot:960268_1